MKKSTLNTIKSTGFKIPKHYFENLEHEVLAETRLKNQFIKTGYTTPSDYFENFEVSISKNLKPKKQHKIITLIPRKTLIYWSGIAAMVVVVFKLQTTTPKANFETIDTTSVEAYFEDEDLDLYEIATLFETKDLSELSLITIKETALESYILEHATAEDLLDFEY